MARFSSPRSCALRLIWQRAVSRRGGQGAGDDHRGALGLTVRLRASATRTLLTVLSRLDGRARRGTGREPPGPKRARRRRGAPMAGPGAMKRTRRSPRHHEDPALHERARASRGVAHQGDGGARMAPSPYAATISAIVDRGYVGRRAQATNRALGGRTRIYRQHFGTTSPSSPRSGGDLDEVPGVGEQGAVARHFFTPSGRRFGGQDHRGSR